MARSDTITWQRWAVFGGVGMTLAGAALFGRGLTGFEAIVVAPLEGDGGLTILAGLFLLGVGVSLATSSRFGAAGILAGLGVPALAFGLTAAATGLFAPEEVQMASAAVQETTRAASPLLLVSGILASMIGLALLLVFSVRAKTVRR